LPATSHQGIAASADVPSRTASRRNERKVRAVSSETTRRTDSTGNSRMGSPASSTIALAIRGRSSIPPFATAQ